jgi:DNA-binding CsgD family transcriptional regulator
MQSWASRRKAHFEKDSRFSEARSPRRKARNEPPESIPVLRIVQRNGAVSRYRRIAGLLAMQCLVRGQNPADFQVLVPAEQSLVGRLISRTEELLKEGRAIACPTSLSARQREVLDAVVSNRANKEIASRLNITVRTVKFHVSSLLSKFGVETRAELARRAAGFMRPTLLENEARTQAQVNKGGRNLVPEQAMQKTALAMANGSRSLRFPGRVLTA